MTFCMNVSRVRWIIITFGAPTHILKSCMTWVTCVFPLLSRTPLSCQCFRLWSRILGAVPCQRMENDSTCFSFRVVALAYLLKLKRNCKRLELRGIRFLRNNHLQKPSVQSGSLSAPDLNCYSKQMWFINTQTLLLLRFPERCFSWVTIMARGSADRPDGGIGGGCGAAVLCINMRELAGSL